MTRLWTFQDKAILSLIEANRRHIASWEFAPENFRPAYLLDGQASESTSLAND
jgi:hypothetical protein